MNCQERGADNDGIDEICGSMVGVGGGVKKDENRRAAKKRREANHESSITGPTSRTHAHEVIGRVLLCAIDDCLPSRCRITFNVPAVLKINFYLLPVSRETFFAHMSFLIFSNLHSINITMEVSVALVHILRHLS